MADDDRAQTEFLSSDESERLAFLRKIERAQFPFRVSDPELVALVQVLLQAGLVEGGIGRSPSDQRVIAVVRQISALGRGHLALTRNSGHDRLDR